MRRSFTLAGAVMAVAVGSAQAQETELFRKLDQNQDGLVAKDEVGENARGLFERLVRMADGNRDGQLSPEEFANGLANRSAGAAADEPAVEARTPANAERGAARQLLARFDKNGDGKLSKSEAPERIAERFARLDIDRNGELDKAELAVVPALPLPMQGQPMPGMNASALLDRLKMADKNGDGLISKSESPERLKASFDRIDANRNGQLDPGEVRAWLSKVRP